MPSWVQGDFEQAVQKLKQESGEACEYLRS
jgi:hypothetical protein